jgi:hypothetical protein
VLSATSPRLRRGALLSSGAWAVHELRFALAPVDGGQGPGHSYLHAALPLLTALLALAVAGFAARLAAPRLDEAPRPLRHDWFMSAVLLIGAFVLQEGIEAALTAHGAIFAGGGWLALPLALVVGLLVALCLRGARAAVAAAASRPARLRPPAPTGAVLAFSLPAGRPRTNAPPRHLAARPPPGLLVHQP